MISVSCRRNINLKFIHYRSNGTSSVVAIVCWAVKCFHVSFVDPNYIIPLSKPSDQFRYERRILASCFLITPSAETCVTPLIYIVIIYIPTSIIYLHSIQNTKQTKSQNCINVIKYLMLLNLCWAISSFSRVSVHLGFPRTFGFFFVPLFIALGLAVRCVYVIPSSFRERTQNINQNAKTVLSGAAAEPTSRDRTRQNAPLHRKLWNLFSGCNGFVFFVW